jgi:hypothetical protein
LLARVGPLQENQKTQLFLAGLGEPLSLDVQIQGPQSLAMAMSLARSFERHNVAAAAALQPRAPPPAPPRSRPPPPQPPLLAAPTSAATPAAQPPKLLA